MYKKGRVNSNSRIISTDEDLSLRIESSAIINLRGVSTKLNKYIVFTMQTYKKLIKYFIFPKTLNLILYTNVIHKTFALFGCLNIACSRDRDDGARDFFVIPR